MTWLAVPRNVLEDADHFRRHLDCMFWLALHAPDYPEPLTVIEQMTGRRYVAHDDHDHAISVAWRPAMERREADAIREAEMAVCPYVACQCGHHDDG